MVPFLAYARGKEEREKKISVGADRKFLVVGHGGRVRLTLFRLDSRFRFGRFMAGDELKRVQPIWDSQPYVARGLLPWL
jgi:hypothetical protein